MKLLLAAAVALALTGPAVAWDGYDHLHGDGLTVERGVLVRPQQDLDVYDWRTGRLNRLTIEDVRRNGRDTDVEVFDWNRLEFRTYTFERNRGR